MRGLRGVLLLDDDERGVHCPRVDQQLDMCSLSSSAVVHLLIEVVMCGHWFPASAWALAVSRQCSSTDAVARAAPSCASFEELGRGNIAMMKWKCN